MKQTYVIDGYNLLHAMGVLLGRVEGPQVLEKARRQLLDDLAKAFEADAGLLTVVFDAAVAPRRSQPEQTIQGIRVLFAVGGQEADDLIESLITQHPHPRHLSVVSDDHRLQRAARRRQAQDMSCGAFLDLLEQRGKARGEGPKSEAPAGDAKQADDSQAEKEHWLAEFGHLQQDLDRHDLPVRLEKLPPARPGKQKKPPAGS
jgi:predicted RNA-binding protein with PIN domain